MPARTFRTGEPPPAFDKECDVDIPGRVYSAWKPTFGPREVVRELTAEERGKMEARAGALQEALAEFRADEQQDVFKEIAAMFAGYRRENITAGSVTMTLKVLREFPPWAIAQVCFRVATDKSGLDNRFVPTDAQLHHLATEIVRPYRDRLREAKALLEAPIEKKD